MCGGGGGSKQHVTFVAFGTNSANEPRHVISNNVAF